MKIITVLFVASIAGTLSSGLEGYGFSMNMVSSYKYDEMVQMGMSDSDIGEYYSSFGYPWGDWDDVGTNFEIVSMDSTTTFSAMSFQPAAVNMPKSEYYHDEVNSLNTRVTLEVGVHGTILALPNNDNFLFARNSSTPITMVYSYLPCYTCSDLDISGDFYSFDATIDSMLFKVQGFDVDLSVCMQTNDATWTGTIN